MTIPFLIDHPLILLLAVLVLVLGVARLTRVITYDQYPPTIAFRSWWIRRVTKGNGWGKLADCWWCAAPWVMAPAIGVFFLTPLQPWILWTWWIGLSWLSLAYVASMVIARDEPADEHDHDA